jgi:hypothetical protein
MKQNGRIALEQLSGKRRQTPSPYKNKATRPSPLTPQPQSSLQAYGDKTITPPMRSFSASVAHTVEYTVDPVTEQLLDSKLIS